MVLYKIVCTLTNKAYVGVTTGTMRARFKAHLRDAAKGKGWLLHAAIRKYGKANFAAFELGAFATWQELCAA